MHDFLNEGNFYVTIMSQILFFLSASGFFQAQKTFWLVLRPGPRWRNLRRSLHPPSRTGRGTPPPHSSSFDAFGVWIASSSALLFSTPSAYRPPHLRHFRFLYLLVH